MEGLPMANSKINFTLTSGADIKKLDELANGISAQRSALDNERQGAKIEQYQHVLTDLALSGVKLTKRGKNQGLPLNVMSDLREQLSEAGVSKASVKRLSEKSNKLLRVMPEILDCKSYGEVALVLSNAGLTTESKITAKVSEPVDPLDVIAEKLFDLDQADRNVVFEKLAKLDKDAKDKAESLKKGAENGEDLTAAQNAFADVA
jgi:hypothetical protein